MSTVSDAADTISCSTGLSRDVLSHLKRMQLTGHAWNVCAHCHDLTFGNAGWRRRQGESEITCTFDLASWADALAVNRSQLLRTMQRLVKHGILTMTPQEQPGRYTVAWNVNFQEWQPGYDSHRTSKQAENLKEHAQKRPSSLSSVDALNAPSRLSLPAKVVSIESKLARLNATIESKDACSSTSASVPPRALNKSTEEEITEEETYIAADAAQGSLFDVPIATSKGTKLVARNGSKKAYADLLQVMLDGGAAGPEGGEWAKWNKGFQQLQSCQVDAHELQDLLVAYVRRCPTYERTPNAIYSNLGKLRRDVQKKTGAYATVKTGASNYGPGNDEYAWMYD